MIRIENTEVVGWEAAIRGMRNPMNSWEKSDSGMCEDFQCGFLDGISGYLSDTRPICPLKNANECGLTGEYIIGPNDLDLMKRLASGGPVHAKYRRMITVYVDITAPLYWWKEFDTYKVGTVANSCSTMHKITDKEFTLEDFSCEHLVNIYTLQQVIKDLNFWRDAYLINDGDERVEYIRSRFDPEKVDPFMSKKDCWWQMIQLLPSSYNQKRTIMLNYEVLAHIYKDRKYHKLDEWSEHEAPMNDVTTSEDLVKGDIQQHLVPGVKEYFGFCDWIKTLPYSELITGGNENAGKCEN